MKTKMKALTLVLCAVLLVCASVMGTLAYLQSTSDVVTNTFSVGKVNITLDEAPVNEYGVVVDGARRIQNTYKLIPGHSYTKDPVIHIKGGSEVCYLFVKITNDISAIEGTNTVHAQMIANGWVVVDQANGIYGKETPLDAREIAENSTLDVAVFGSVNIANDADVSNFVGKTITVQACAIQADGFTSMLNAWQTGLGSTFPTK